MLQRTRWIWLQLQGSWSPTNSPFWTSGLRLINGIVTTSSGRRMIRLSHVWYVETAKSMTESMTEWRCSTCSHRSLMLEFDKFIPRPVQFYQSKCFIATMWSTTSCTDVYLLTWSEQCGAFVLACIICTEVVWENLDQPPISTAIYIGTGQHQNPTSLIAGCMLESGHSKSGK